MALVQDIDMTILTRSLKLLHSPDSDSAEQLRTILEDTIKSKYGNKKTINLSGLGLNKKTSIIDEPARGKKLKLDHSSTNSALYSGPVEESQSSESDSDDGVALEILDDDLTCVVCREMAVGAGNNLVECLECHSLYHQECHTPPITQDVNDPRFVWYCANCTKTINKSTSSSSSKGSPNNSVHLSKPVKASTKSSTSSSKSFGGFSSSGKTSSKHSSSGQSSSKSSSVPVPKINITADKRLQIMKKNAAKKQEKRKLTK